MAPRVFVMPRDLRPNSRKGGLRVPPVRRTQRPAFETENMIRETPRWLRRQSGGKTHKTKNRR